MKKALIAMSGGVDSSVAAKLMLDAGYDCMGATMKLFDSDDILMAQREKTCCSLSDVEDARSVARRLGMPYQVFNFKGDFKEKVIDKFIATYEAGGTPNPCIDCNKCLKFDTLCRRAIALGYDYVVTGHYARIDCVDGRYRLRKALDDKKDQSYVLYNLSQEQLAHTLFPLGELHKDQVRAIAEENGFINAHKRESQDICFVPDGDYAAFIESYTRPPLSPRGFCRHTGECAGPPQGHYSLHHRPAPWAGSCAAGAAVCVQEGSGKQHGDPVPQRPTEQYGGAGDRVQLAEHCSACRTAACCCQDPLQYAPGALHRRGAARRRCTANL